MLNGFYFYIKIHNNVNACECWLTSWISFHMILSMFNMFSFTAQDDLVKLFLALRLFLAERIYLADKIFLAVRSFMVLSYF